MKKKGLNLLVALLFTAVALTGCGEKETSASQKDTEKKTSISADEKDADISADEEKDDIADNSDKEEGDTGLDLFAPKIAPVAEEDAFVNIGGVEVKMDQTWEEFQQLVEENGWIFINKEVDFPNENKLLGSGEVQTNCGIISFSFMKSEDETTSELGGITFDPADLTNDNVNIAGIDIYTKYDDVEGILQFNREGRTGKVYNLDDYLIVSIKPLTTGDTAIISVSRIMYNQR